MAILNCLLGTLSGKVGDVVFKQRNGKTYVSRAPVQRENPFGEYEKARHNKFTYVAKIASAINNHPVFREIWRKVTPKKSSPFQKIVQNLHKYLNNDLSGIVQFVPGIGFSLSNPQIVIRQAEIIITAKLNRAEEIESVVNKKVIAAGIIILPENENSLDPGMRTINIQSDSHKIIFRRTLSFVISLSLLEQQLIKTRKKIKILLCLVLINKAGEPENYSLTVEAEKEFNGKDWN